MEASNYRNHFTVFSAREAMWRALTLTNKDGTPATRVAGDNQDQVRKAYWASTFRALGDVTHLVQDMAQPQHTRNEAHASDTAAILEKYTEARTTNARTFRFEGTTLQVDAIPSLPALNSYSVPRFNRYSDYWSSAGGTDSLDIGKGLADYSSRSFFTPNQSLGDPFSGFPRPVNMESAYTISKNPPPGGNPCPGLVLGFPEYAWANVPDTISGVPSNPVRMGSRSLLPSRWAISRCVLLDQANLLIPRAVAYSAGLIDYFFRGQLEVTPPEEGVYSLIDHYELSGAGKNPTDATTGFKGFKTIKLKLRNATPDITPSGGGSAAPQIMPGGNLVAVLKFYRNKNYSDDLAGEPTTAGNGTAMYVAGRSTNEEIVLSARVKDSAGTILTPPIAITNSLQTFIFEFDNELPINVTDVKLQVVYRGVLGSEADAVVVQTVDISEPTYFAYMNASDYIKLGASVYTRDQINANTPQGATLRSQVYPSSCILNDQLRDTCLQPFPINFPIKWGNASAFNGSIALPIERTYQRFAMLVPPGGQAIINQAASPCFPNDPITALPRLIQTNYPAPDYFASTFVTSMQPPIRAIQGGFMLACVNNGDSSPPGSDDNRDQVMSPLTGSNLKPVQVPGFNFGAP